MKLDEWRRNAGMTQQQLADAVPCDISSVARWEAGTREPDRAAKEKIFLLSEGAVEPNDFYDMPAWKRALAALVARLSGEAA